MTLLIDANAALFASRDPRDYDLTPGGCGVVNQRGRGCKPFLLADWAPASCAMARSTGAAGLGRPWRPYARVVFLHTEMGAHVEAAGWREWHPGETRYMDTVSYAEFENSGAGAHHTEREAHTTMLTPAEAAAYEARRFLTGADGWDPTTRRQ